MKQSALVLALLLNSACGQSGALTAPSAARPTVESITLEDVVARPCGTTSRHCDLAKDITYTDWQNSPIKKDVDLSKELKKEFSAALRDCVEHPVYHGYGSEKVWGKFRFKCDAVSMIESNDAHAELALFKVPSGNFVFAIYDNPDSDGGDITDIGVYTEKGKRIASVVSMIDGGSVIHIAADLLEQHIKEVEDPTLADTPAGRAATSEAAFDKASPAGISPVATVAELQPNTQLASTLSMILTRCLSTQETPQGMREEGFYSTCHATPTMILSFVKNDLLRSVLYIEFGTTPDNHIAYNFHANVFEANTLDREASDVVVYEDGSRVVVAHGVPVSYTKPIHALLKALNISL